MPIEFDPLKDDQNVRERGLSFELVADFDWPTALVREDTRRPYSERRFVALGLIDGREHVVVFTPRGLNVRVISLRRASRKERKHYADHRL